MKSLNMSFKKEDLWFKQNEYCKKWADKYTEELASGLAFAIFGKPRIEMFCDEVVKEKTYAQTTKQA